MNRDFQQVLTAPPRDRRDLFQRTANRLGTTEQHVEKDFWVCWILDLLFNQLPKAGPRLLFKGGTSLSKGYGLINRFSEDIDITVFRDDIGEASTAGEMEALSGKGRRARLEAIRDACREYVQGCLRDGLAGLVSAALSEAGIADAEGRVLSDDQDPDGQSLLFRYPTSTHATDDDYVRPTVRIESGAKSALTPHEIRVVVPYVRAEVSDLRLEVPNVTTVHPARTFWDKVIILHGTRRWFEQRGHLRQEGQRVTRHYYDVHKMLASHVGLAAAKDRDLGLDCVQHARMFFGRPDLGLESAKPGSFAITPIRAMEDRLRADYTKMSGMIFGPIPPFDAVMQSIADLEARLNSGDA